MTLPTDKTHRDLSPPVKSHSLAIVCAFAIIIIVAALLLDGLHHVNKGELGAFATYYKAATLMRMGNSPYGPMRGYPYVYPPLWAWLCQPLTTLPRGSAALLMMSLNAGLLVGALFLSARSALIRFSGSTSLGRALPVTLVALLLVCVQFHKDVRLLQTDLIIMLAFVLAIALLDQRPRWAGVALAFAISVKYVPLLAVPYLLLRRRWSVLVGLALGLLFWATLPATTLGVNTNFQYLRQSVGGLSHLTSAGHPMITKAGLQGSDEARVHGLTDKMDHSITSALARLATELHLPMSAGLAFDALIAAGWVALMLRLTSGSLRSAVRWPRAAAQSAGPYGQRIGLEWAVLMTCAIVFSPSAILIIAIYPAALFATLLLRFPHTHRSPRMLVGASLLFLALLFPFDVLGSKFEVAWNAAGMSCWILLVSCSLLVDGARRRLNLSDSLIEPSSNAQAVSRAADRWSVPLAPARI